MLLAGSQGMAKPAETVIRGISEALKPTLGEHAWGSADQLSKMVKEVRGELLRLRRQAGDAPATPDATSRELAIAVQPFMQSLYGVTRELSTRSPRQYTALWQRIIEWILAGTTSKARYVAIVEDSERIAEMLRAVDPQTEEQWDAELAAGLHAAMEAGGSLPSPRLPPQAGPGGDRPPEGPEVFALDEGEQDDPYMNEQDASNHLAEGAAGQDAPRGREPTPGREEERQDRAVPPEDVHVGPEAPAEPDPWIDNLWSSLDDLLASPVSVGLSFTMTAYQGGAHRPIAFLLSAGWLLASVGRTTVRLSGQAVMLAAGMLTTILGVTANSGFYLASTCFAICAAGLIGGLIWHQPWGSSTTKNLATLGWRAPSVVAQSFTGERPRYKEVEPKNEAAAEQPPPRPQDASMRLPAAGALAAQRSPGGAALLHQALGAAGVPGLPPGPRPLGGAAPGLLGTQPSPGALQPPPGGTMGGGADVVPPTMWAAGGAGPGVIPARGPAGLGGAGGPPPPLGAALERVKGRRRRTKWQRRIRRPRRRRSRRRRRHAGIPRRRRMAGPIPWRSRRRRRRTTRWTTRPRRRCPSRRRMAPRSTTTRRHDTRILPRRRRTARRWWGRRRWRRRRLHA